MLGPIMSTNLYLRWLIIFLALHPHTVTGNEERGAHDDVKEAVVGVDALNGVLDSLPSEGGLLRLIYSNSEGPALMETLNVKNRRVTIQGQGSQGPVLTCNGSEPAIKIMGGFVEVLDLAIHGCVGIAVEIKSPEGPRADWGVKIHRCVFVSNLHAVQKGSDEEGGALGGYVKITQSDFISNVGSALELQDVKSIEVSKSKFENNTSGGFGGGVMVQVNGDQLSNLGTILQTGDEQNKAESRYGVGGEGEILADICCYGEVSISESNFTNNRGMLGGGIAVGGFYDSPNVTVHISKCMFLNNTASKGGGGVYLYNIISSTLESSAFEHCSSKDVGGGVYFACSAVDGVMVVRETDFKNNTSGAGGGIFGSAEEESLNNFSKSQNVGIKIQDCKFLNNSALRAGGGGVVVQNISSITLDATVFKHCFSRLSGGGLVFVSRHAHKPWVVDVAMSVFVGNRVKSGYGGAIFVGSSVNGSVSIRETELVNNVADFGGGISTRALMPSLSIVNDPADIRAHIQNCHFSKNLALSEGGGIYFDNINSVSLSTSVFEGCTSNIVGGAVAVQSESVSRAYHLSVVNSVFNGSRSELFGGGIYATSKVEGSMTLKNTNFTNNTALSMGGGVALLVTLTSREKPADFKKFSVDIFNCHFLQNAAFEGFGGGIYLDGVGHTAVESSTFNECLGGGGGGGIAVQFFDIQIPWEFSLGTSVFKANKAPLSLGGGVQVTSVADGIMRVQETTFLNNTANHGGGIAVTVLMPPGHDNLSANEIPSTSVHMSKCEFAGNIAVDGLGGGALLWNITVASVRSSIFAGCRAKIGGVMHWMNEIKTGLLSFQSSNCSHNSAEYGGCFGFDGMGQLKVTRCGFEENESSNEGGVLYVLDAGMNPNGIVLSESTFLRNKALVGGVVYGLNVHQVLIEQTLFQRNTAGVGGAIALTPGSSARLDFRAVESKFVENTAQGEFSVDGKYSEFEPYSGGGGAIAIISFFRSKAHKASAIWKVELQSSSFKGNIGRNGGAMLALSTAHYDGKWMNIEECTFQDNSVLESGGALAVDNPYEIGVVCVNGEASRSLHQSSPAFCATWSGNSITSDSGMDAIPNTVAALSLGAMELNQTHVERAQSRPHFPAISLTILDALNMSRFYGGIGEVEVMAGCHDKEIALFGDTKQFAVNGTAIFTGIHAWGPPGNYTITFNATNRVGFQKTAAIQANLTFELRDCQVGEWSFKESGRYLRCEHCNAKFFSLVPSKEVCEECVENAECASSEDNPVHPLVPRDGYWHSSPFSKQIHKCINQASCRFNGRIRKLQSFTSGNLPEYSRQYTQEEYPLCSEGSDGPLCGSCKEGYSHVKNGQCTKCKSRFWAVGGIVVGGMWTAVVMWITMYGNLHSVQDSFEGDVQEGTEMENIQLLENGEDICAENGPESRNSLVDILSGECWSVRRSLQLFKIGVNFFQVNSAALQMRFGWVSFLMVLLEIQDASTLSTASSYGNWLVPQCAFHDMQDRAIIVAYLDVAIPIALTVSIAAAWTGYLVLCNRDGSWGAAIEITLWSCALYAYNGLTKSLMGVFNCIEVDRDDPGDPLNPYAISKGLYWAADTQFHCFHGTQRILLLLTGLTGAVLFLVGLPLYLCIFLYRMREGLESPVFMKKYGFLYQTYMNEFAYWEAAIMGRKFLITTFGVFGASLGDQLQGDLMLGVVVAASIAQTNFKPFKDPELNSMEAWSLLTTCFTFYLGGVMEDTSTVWKVLLSLMIFIVNLIFCGALGLNLMHSIVKEGITQRILERPLVRWLCSMCRSALAWCFAIARNTREWVAWKLRDWI